MSQTVKKLFIHSFYMDTDTALNGFRRKRGIQGGTHKQCFKCF